MNLSESIILALMYYYSFPRFANAKKRLICFAKIFMFKVLRAALSEFLCKLTNPVRKIYLLLKNSFIKFMPL